jgi:predicted naringenin-chalcone synthase
MAYINKISTVLPQYKFKQMDIYRYMLEAYNIPKEMEGKIEAMYAKGGIAFRHSVVPDFNIANPKTLFAHPNPTVQQRMEVYNANATQLGKKALAELAIEPTEVTHLITVSCTGMCAPGLDILLMQAMNLPANCVRTSVNFMGCYALVHALKLANAFCATQPNAQVIIVLVELCTLHFQHTNTMENIATSMLFADGCCALLVSNTKTDKALQLTSFYSEVQDNSLQDMAWHITDTGFAMSLSAYVPSIIGQNIQSLLERALKSAGLQKSDIALWAIHPGGKKIVAEIKNALELSAQDVSISTKILEENGNMSSVTLGFVLKEMMQVAKPAENIFGVAFGPGLTMETVVLQAC